ncbi:MULTISPECIES: ABC transporter ATP-binding protein [unclassified Pseudomonas]|uniref:ABC transporter ATP-binding protein n=1 Tax=unclassified Pseudomonas TaxID=196821 RepID=UPI000DAF021D|nr:MULTISPECIES: ABC transporter ATP-binding protein [unclassified Pseudomonas]MBD9653686.1 ABC transporter ATP-binding protein [Pseudomonas sp. PDM12]PZW49807.1 peptide/nickel transport system ATP-binding protein [Pseudomonas sp. URMO17WK12:I2]CAH0282547.1 Oligopeptide transport ATP-binding protein OppF [Pseudomonas sp. Bi70]
MAMIEVDSLNLSFGVSAARNQVLYDVALRVEEGESFGLVGESGSGKTTVLRCLAGQYRHWEGQLSIAGRGLRHKLDMAHFRQVQMVFQDPYGSLHPRHTIDSALSEPLAVHGIGDRGDRVTAILNKVGLNESFRYRYPHQLSGGQRQRVAIARALILEPRVLLLDEPTSALDVSVQAEILNLLSDLREQEGLTYLLVTHDLGVVAHLCDRVAVMQHGRIVETLDTVLLAQNRAEHAYTQLLVDASRDIGAVAPP